MEHNGDRQKENIFKKNAEISRIRSKHGRGEKKTNKEERKRRGKNLWEREVENEEIVASAERITSGEHRKILSLSCK